MSEAKITVFSTVRPVPPVPPSWSRQSIDDFQVAGTGVTVTIYDGHRVEGTFKTRTGIEATAKFPNAKLWDTKTPFLYDLKVQPLPPHPSQVRGFLSEFLTFVLSCCLLDCFGYRRFCH